MNANNAKKSPTLPDKKLARLRKAAREILLKPINSNQSDEDRRAYEQNLLLSYGAALEDAGHLHIDRTSNAKPKRTELESAGQNNLFDAKEFPQIRP